MSSLKSWVTTYFGNQLILSQFFEYLKFCPWTYEWPTTYLLSWKRYFWSPEQLGVKYGVNSLKRFCNQAIVPRRGSCDWWPSASWSGIIWMLKKQKYPRFIGFPATFRGSVLWLENKSVPSWSSKLPLSRGLQIGNAGFEPPPSRLGSTLLHDTGASGRE